VRDFGRLPRPVQERLRPVLDQLAEEPRPGGVIAVQGSRGLLRVRVGDYRALYRVHDDRSEVEVVLIDYRDRVYQRLRNLP
jgi:mRNA interferase RelE/StbE